MLNNNSLIHEQQQQKEQNIEQNVYTRWFTTTKINTNRFIWCWTNIIMKHTYLNSKWEKNVQTTTKYLINIHWRRGRRREKNLRLYRMRQIARHVFNAARCMHTKYLDHRCAAEVLNGSGKPCEKCDKLRWPIVKWRRWTKRKRIREKQTNHHSRQVMTDTNHWEKKSSSIFDHYHSCYSLLIS